MSFRDIRGQDRAIGVLKGYIEQSHLQGGYIFAGPEGIGKRLTALTLAKAVNCKEQAADSCDSCPSCRKIDSNTHPDLHLLDPEGSEIKIEDIRQIQKEISLRPYEAEKKVFIINNAHQLTAESSNCLLKVLEEPPKNSLLILITDKPALLFKTITSRCKVLRFSAFGRRELFEVFRKEHGLDNDSAHYLAYFSEGRLGCALRLKAEDFLRQKNSVIDKIALSAKRNLDDLSLQDKEEVREYLNILAAWFRDIYMAKAEVRHSEFINFDRKDELLKAASSLSFAELNDILDSITASILGLEQNLNVRLLLYNLKVKLWKN